jgi:hypothetical protein
VSRRRQAHGGTRQNRSRLPADLGQIDWQAVDWACIDASLARFDAAALAVFLAAAADSPGGGHRLPSLIVLWLRCLASPPGGTLTATPAHLPRLLSAARRAAPQLEVLEDSWPADPRLLVRFPVAGQRLRVHPGSWGNPVRILRPVAATAEAVDEFVLGRHGFTVTDLMEVALRYCDYRMSVLAGTWPADGLVRDRPDRSWEDLRSRVRRIARTPVAVTAGEVAAGTGTESGEWIRACQDPVRAEAAWRWATRPAADVNVDLVPGAERLGAVLAVSSMGRDWPVPAAMVAGAVATAAAALAAEAAGDEPSERRMLLVTVRRVLQAFGHPVVAMSPQAPEEQDSREETAGESPTAPVLITVPGSRHAFVVGFASGLDGAGLDRSVEQASAAAGAVTAEIVQAAENGFDTSGSVFRFVIYGGPLVGTGLAYQGATCVHVDHLITAALDADQADTSEHIGRELLWQFLDELATLPGVSDLRAWGFDDIWQVWLDRGVLNPGGQDGITVQTFVLPDQDSWERSAAWEPLEVVLADAGLPPSWEWAFAHFDEPGQATVGENGEIYQLLADPPLIMHVPVEKEMARLGIDPSFVLGVADGVRQTVQNYAGVAAAVTAGQRLPLVCNLRLRPRRPPDERADAVGVELGATRGPPPQIDLLLYADWLEFLAEDPAGGHAVLGRALSEGLRQALHLTDEAADAFVAAWQAAVPVAALKAAETTLPPAFGGRNRLPRSPATLARARRAISVGIVRSDVPLRTVYTGAGAAGLCTDVILPAADAALKAAIAGWSPATLLAVARCLNDAHAERARRTGLLAQALTAPWGADWQRAALHAPEPAMLTRPLELLLETLLARTTTGIVDADIFEIAEAADLAGTAIEVSLYLAATRHRLHDLAVILDESGQFTITDMPPGSAVTTTIDIGAYRRADRADQLRLRPQPLEGTPVQLTEERSSRSTDFVRLSDVDVPGTLLAADTILRQQLGTGIDGIRAVLGTAVTWTPGSDDVTEISSAELRDAAIAWSHLPPEQVDAALSLLTLTPGHLLEEGIPYWELERRTYRLATRPLICAGDSRLVLVPRLIEASQGIYVTSVFNGRLPWPPTAVPRSVSDAFNNFRKTPTRDLELRVLQILDDLGVPCRGNIERHHAAPYGLRLTGEIDVIVADPERSRLWVCEVKDVSLTVSPRTLASRVAKFTGPHGYISQVLRSASDIRANPAAAAQLLGVSDPERRWDILPLMITRFVEPAAFTPHPAVPFATVEDLAYVIQQDTPPPPGQIPIKASNLECRPQHLPGDIFRR